MEDDKKGGENMENRKKIEKGWAEHMRAKVSAWEIPSEAEPELYETIVDWDEVRKKEYWDVETPKGYEELYIGDNFGSLPGDIHWEHSLEAEDMGITSCAKLISEIYRRKLQEKEALNFFNKMSKEKYSSVICVYWEASFKFGPTWGVYIFGKKQ